MQTARFSDGHTNLLKDMPALQFEPMKDPPTELSVEIDLTETYQEILGFGGAFTEAAAINWRKLSKADQEEVIRLYFASPEEGGHGYTLGRVPSERPPIIRPWLLVGCSQDVHLPTHMTHGFCFPCLLLAARGCSWLLVAARGCSLSTLFFNPAPSSPTLILLHPAPFSCTLVLLHPGPSCSPILATPPPPPKPCCSYALLHGCHPVP